MLRAVRNTEDRYARRNVEDIVAVRIRLASGQERYILTWGRVHDAIDPLPLLTAVSHALKRFDLGGKPTIVELCPTLDDASDAPYFYETFFKMTQTSIPRGRAYAAWARRTVAGIDAGDELYYLGRRRWTGRSVGRLPVGKRTYRRSSKVGSTS